MNDWIRYEDGRSRAVAEHATICKDGRLIVKNALAREFGLIPGEFVEIYHCPRVSRIAFRVMSRPTPYSIKVTSTTKGGAETFDRPTGEGKGYPSACIALRGFLNSRRIGLSSIVKGKFYRDAENPEMLVFEFAEPPEHISPAAHIKRQFEKDSVVESVVGDKA